MTKCTKENQYFDSIYVVNKKNPPLRITFNFYRVIYYKQIKIIH